MIAAEFFQSYAISFLFWLGLGAGSLGVLLMQDITGGAWGKASAPVLESASLTLPWMAALFLPILFGARYVFPWWAPSADAHFNHAYLNPSFFTIRAAIYFALWTFTALGLERWAERRRAGQGAWWAAPVLVAHILSITFAVIDWAASIEAPWSSTVYGFLWTAGFGLSAFCLCVLASAWRAGRAPLPPKYSHDLGNLTLAALMLWAYLSYVQWLIIWSGDVPDEIKWYLLRAHLGWQWVAACLAGLGFFVPFYALLMRSNKRNLRRLALVAWLLIALRVVDVVWIVAPSFGVGAFHPRPLHFIVFIGLGVVWLALFARNFSRKAFEPARFYGA